MRQNDRSVSSTNGTTVGLLTLKDKSSTSRLSSPAQHRSEELPESDLGVDVSSRSSGRKDIIP